MKIKKTKQKNKKTKQKNHKKYKGKSPSNSDSFHSLLFESLLPVLSKKDKIKLANKLMSKFTVNELIEQIPPKINEYIIKNIKINKKLKIKLSKSVYNWYSKTKKGGSEVGYPGTDVGDDDVANLSDFTHQSTLPSDSSEESSDSDEYINFRPLQSIPTRNSINTNIIRASIILLMIGILTTDTEESMRALSSGLQKLITGLIYYFLWKSLIIVWRGI